MGKVSRKSVSSQILDKYVGSSRDTIPLVHLPTNRVVLQRYRGIRFASGTAGRCDYKTGYMQQCWSEVEDVWNAARIPTTTEHNEKKLQALCQWFDKVGSNKRYLETPDTVRGSSKDNIAEIEANLNRLFDIAPLDIEQQMRSSLNPEWKVDYAFYLNQQVFPQTSVMEGKDLKVDALEKRREKRNSAENLLKEKACSSRDNEEQPSCSNQDSSSPYRYE